MSTQSASTRTCSSCGQPKALLAFLELSGDSGQVYGNVCSTCRGAGLGKPKVETVDSDSGDGIGHKLDNKARVKDAIENREEKEHRTDLELEEKHSKDERDLEKIEDVDHKEQAQKKHRKEYIESGKFGFLAPNIVAPEIDLEQAVLHSEEMKTGNDKEHAIHSSLDIQAGLIEEVHKTHTDLSHTFVDEHTATIGRSGGSLFDQFRKMVGRSAVGMNNITLETYHELNKSKVKSPTFLQPAKAPEPAETEGAATEFVKNNMKSR